MVCALLPFQLKVGDTVVRGPDWSWGEQDGGAGKKGKVMEAPEGVVYVKWEANGKTIDYFYGKNGRYDVQVVPTAAPEVSFL